MKRGIVAIVFLASAIVAFAQSRHGSILLQAGIGAALPFVEGDVLQPFAAIEATAGIAISDRLYATVGVDSVRQVGEGSSESTIGIFSILGGMRFYPLVTGPYLAAQAGVGGIRIYHITEDDEISDPAFTVGACAGYDISRKPRGFSLALEAGFFIMFFEGGTLGAATLTASICHK